MLALVVVAAAEMSVQALAQQEPANSQATSSETQRQADLLYQKGMQLLNGRRYNEALEQFRRLEKTAPQLPYGLAGEGTALALMGHPTQAIDKLKKALSIDPSFWIAQRALGILYWRQNLKVQAVKQLSPLARMFPSDATVNLILGQYSFEQKQYAEALEFFSKAPGQVVQKPDLTLMQATSLIKTGKAKQASQVLEQLSHKTLPNEQRFQLAWLLGQAKDYKGAITVFESLPAGYPDAFHRDYGIALAYFENGQPAESIKKLESLLKSGVTRPELYSLLGVAEEKSGHTKKAYDAFRQGILGFPQNPQNYLNIATLACQHLNYDLAVQILTSGIQQMPDSHELVLSRGISYTLAANFTAAEKDFDRAIKMDPADPQNYLSLGLCLLEEGSMEKAVAAFEQATAKDPKASMPYFFITEALLQKGVGPGTPAFAKARKAIETAVSLNPDFPQAYRDRAKLELRAGQVDAAAADLEHAFSMDPNSASISYMLARVYERKGEKAKARQLFAQIKQQSEERARNFRRDSLTNALVVISNGSH